MYMSVSPPQESCGDVEGDRIGSDRSAIRPRRVMVYIYIYMLSNLISFLSILFKYDLFFINSS